MRRVGARYIRRWTIRLIRARTVFTRTNSPPVIASALSCRRILRASEREGGSERESFIPARVAATSDKRKIDLYVHIHAHVQQKSAGVRSVTNNNSSPLGYFRMYLSYKINDAIRMRKSISTSFNRLQQIDRVRRGSLYRRDRATGDLDRRRKIIRLVATRVATLF